MNTVKRRATCVAFAALLIAHAAGAAESEGVWTFGRVTNTEAAAGQTCTFSAEVSAPRGPTVPVQIQMTCDRDAALKDTAIPVVAGPS